MTGFRLRPTLFAISITVAALAAAALIAIAALRSSDALLERTLEWSLSAILDRDLEIGRLLDAELAPDAYLLAEDVQLANPGWADTADFARAGRLLLRINLPSLWRSGPVVIHRLELDDAALNLQAPEGRSPNWQFRSRDSAPPDSDRGEGKLPVLVKEARVKRGTVTYRDPDQDVAALLEQGLITEHAETGLLTLDLSGMINDRPLTASGQLGPSQALLTGRDLALDLQLSWGQLRVAGRGRIADLFKLAGADLHLDISAPSSRSLLDLLGMPEVRDGPLRFEGHLTDAGPGLALDARGSLEEFDLAVKGVIVDPGTADGVDLAFELDGPSLAESGAAFELAGLPDIPYSVKGQLNRQGSLLELRDIRVVAGEAELAIDARLPAFPGIDDWRATVEGHRVNLALIAPALGIEGVPDQPYEVSGILSSDEAGVELVDLTLASDDSRLMVNGLVGERPGYFGTRLQLTLSGRDMSRTAPWFGFRNLPQQAFELSGQVAYGQAGWQLKDGALASDGLAINVSGEMDRVVRATRLEGRAGIAVPDLAATLAAYGIAHPDIPSVPLEFTGDLRGRPDRVVIDNGLLRSGDSSANLEGTLGDLARFTGIDLEVAAQGPDLREFLPLEAQPGSAPMPFSVGGHVATAGQEILLSRVSGTVGGNDLQLEGSLPRPGESGGTKLKLAASGASLPDALGTWIDHELPADPFDINLDIDYAPPLLNIKNLRASVEGHRLTGQMRMRGTGKRSETKGQLQLAGDSSRELLAMLGVEVEHDDQPYEVNARIGGTSDTISFEPLQATLGKSDLSGRVTLRPGTVPAIEADLSSRVLYFPFPLPDMKELEKEQRAREATETSFDLAEFTDALTREELKERAIPDKPIDLSLLRRFDGSLNYQTEGLYMQPEGGATRVALKLALGDGRMTTERLHWDGPHASGEARIVLDAAGEQPAFDLHIDALRMPLLWLVAGEPDDKEDRLYRMQLSGAGRTMRELAASLNGAAVFHGGGGRMDNRGLDLLLGDLMGEIFDRLDPTSVTEQYTRVECSAGALAVRNGLVEAIPGVILRTDKLDLVSAGTVDLNTEAVSIAFRTRARKGIGISASKALTPYIKLGGTLAHPRLTLDARGAAISGGAAVATAGWSILAEGMWDRWVATAGDPCERLISQASKDDRRDYRTLLAE